MEKEDKIGGLFRTAFEGQKRDLEGEEIEIMMDIISRKAFYRFSFFNFNIYYSAAILSAFLITVCIGSHYLYSHLKNESHAQSSAINSEIGDSFGNSPDKNASERTQPGKSFRIESAGKQNDKIIKAKAILYNSDTLVSDDFSITDTAKVPVKVSLSEVIREVSGNISENPGSAPDKVQDGKQTAPLQRKTIIIVKKDTIYNIDTIQSRPRKIRRKF